MPTDHARRFPHGENRQRRDDAERAGDEERRQIGVEQRARQAGAERRAGGADLVAGKNPAEHHAGLFPAEAIGGEFHRRRHGGDPVEAVEHREQRQAVEREVGERQIEQRQPAQAVIPEQQPAIVEAVGQPAGTDGADEIEDAHHRQHAGRGDRRQPVIVAQRDEMGLDQAVGAAAADEERAEQHPEDRRAARLP